MLQTVFPQPARLVRVLLALSSVACEEPVCPLREASRELRIVDLIAKDDKVMVLLSDGRGLCWGQAFRGECGWGSGTEAWEPYEMTAANCLTAAAPEDGMSIGLDPRYGVVVWGSEGGYEAGDGPQRTNAVTKPLRVEGLPAIVSVETNAGGMFALSDLGEVWWWGGYGFGEVEQRQGLVRTRPFRYPMPELMRSVAAEYDLACFLGRSGQVYCLFDNAGGALGLPLEVPGSFDAVPISLPLAAVSVAVSGATGCALLEDREVWCWGVSPTDDDASPSPTPAPIGVSGTELFVGSGNGCVLDDAGAATCWGDQAALIDDKIGAKLPPQPWQPGLRFEDIAIGYATICGLTDDQRVYCAGAYSGIDAYKNDGELDGFVDIFGRLGPG